MKKRWISIMVVSVMFILNTVSTFAANNVSVYLPANQVWTASLLDQRSGAYNNVMMKLDSVYPTGNATDNYQKIQARIRNSDGDIIMNSSYVTLSETENTQYIPIKNGYLNTETVFFQFRGNTSAAANAVVDYDAR